MWTDIYLAREDDEDVRSAVKKLSGRIRPGEVIYLTDAEFKAIGDPERFKSFTVEEPCEVRMADNPFWAVHDSSTEP